MATTCDTTVGVPVHVLVADRHRTVAEALALGLRQCGLAAEAVHAPEEARRMVEAWRVDVALLDAELVAGDVPAGIRAWLGFADLPVVVLSEDSPRGEDDGLLCAAVRAGVRGWVPRSSPLRQLRTAVDGVVHGETWIPPRLLTALLRDLTEGDGESGEAHRLAALLTPREAEVLGLLCSGLTRCAIAEELFVSPRTVRTHVQNILAKLDVHSSLAAVALARRAGLDPGRPDGVSG